MSKGTFERILIWKSPRLKGIAKLNEFHIYAEGLKRCLEAPEDKKLRILDDLYGIGVPTASTILHFIYPNEFPIMDVRTAEVLFYSGYIESKKRDQKRYVPFLSAIMDIAHDYPKWSLRQIDKALFAYHKIALKRKLHKFLLQWSRAHSEVLPTCKSLCPHTSRSTIHSTSKGRMCS